MTESEIPAAETNRIYFATGSSSPSGGWLRNFLYEPLIHFALLGALLFGVHAYFQDGEAPSEEQIVVSAGKIEHLSAIFSKTWQRPPTGQELQGLIDDYIREEVAYREGKAMGLDQDDTIIRRRIRQKLDFFAEDLASQTEPTEAQLAEFFKSHRESYSTQARLAFRQIFFDPERHDTGLEQEIMGLVKKLMADPSEASQELGDRSLLEYQYDDVSQREVASIFGEDFASTLAGLTLQSWQGPFRSTYGLHLVFVDQRQPGRLSELDEVRDAVRRDWEHLSRQKLAEEFYRGLQSKYRVTVEWPTAPETVKGEK